MDSWRARRATLAALLPELALLLGRPAPAVHERASCRLVDQAILHSRTAPTETLQQLSASLLQPLDFAIVARISTTGPFARVELVRAQESVAKGASGRLLVMKTLDRSWGYRMRRQQSPVHELEILLLAMHSSTRAEQRPIPRLFAAILSPTDYHIVIEHAPGGDLGSYMDQEIEEGCSAGLEEGLVRRWIAETVEALIWLNSVGWVHRDIKPQNLLLTSTGRLLLTDFNSAAPLSPNRPSSSLGSSSASTSRCSDASGVARRYAVTLVGTPDYIAPEILEVAEGYDPDAFLDDGEDSSQDAIVYGAGVDCWSLGIVIFEMLYGVAPFYAEGIPETYERIVNHAETLKLPSSSSVSDSARDLIKRLFVQASDRIDISQVKAHAWLAAEPFGRFATAPPIYTPSPFVVSHDDPPPPEPVGFNISAFFSSPGLSSLRPTPKVSQSTAKLEEEEFWCGMTWIPEADAFEGAGSEGARVAESVGRVAPATVKKPSHRPFETPLRPHHTLSTLRSGDQTPGAPRTSTPHPTSSSKARRMQSDVEQWKQMQDHAVAVGQTARKAHVNPSRLDARVRLEATGTDVESIEESHAKHMLGLDALGERLERLRKLIEL